MKHFTLVASLGLVLPLSAQVTDGDFEAGAGSGAWVEYSTNFGTPFCDAACGTNGYPYTGDWYLWFGGANVGPDTASAIQLVTIPSGTQFLAFWYRQGGGGVVGDSMVVGIDADLLWAATPADAGNYGSYTPVTVDISAYADGQQHLLVFGGLQTDPANIFNAFVDRVSLETNNGSIGLFENESLPGIMVYPNPANGVINLSFNALQGEALVTITDLTGKLVSSERLAEVSRRVYQFDASELNNGAYTMTVELDGTRYSERIVVAH